MRPRRYPRYLALVCALAALAPARASAWDLFHRENAHVREGNRLLARNDARGALREYDLAAREHPASAEVQHNRGLALMRLGDKEKAKEAFLRATEPPARAELRASAYHNLGLVFYEEADAAAGDDEHAKAQRLFREAADACRRSLRIVPGARDTAWNLELSIRRLREQEEREREQREEQERQEQDQRDQDQQDQQDQDQQSQDQDQQDQGQQGQDQGQQDQGRQDQDQQGQDRSQQDQGQQDQDQQAQNERGDGGDQEQGGGAAEQEREASADDTAAGAPEHLRRLLDAIEGSEESLERNRARVRAARERRLPTQDW